MDSAGRTRFLSHPAFVTVLLLGLSLSMLYPSWRSPIYTLDDAFHLRSAMEGKWTDWFRFRPELSEPYIPVTNASFALDLALFGPDKHAAQIAAKTVANPSSIERKNAPRFQIPSATGMRVANAFYHSLAGVFLWAFLLRLGLSASVALILSLLWTVHPMALESVAWISERKNVLAAFFGFASLLAWSAPSTGRWRWPLVCLLYALAVFSKPSALGLLPVLFALEVFNPRHPENGTPRLRSWPVIAARLLVPLVISALGIWATMKSVNREIIPPPGGSIFTALLTDVEIFARYIVNVLLPVNLSFFYGVQPIVSLADARLWLYGIMLLLICGALVAGAGRRHRALALLGLIWFFGALGPNANLVGIPFWMQDRYAYLSVPGLLLAVVAAVRGVVARQPQLARFGHLAWGLPLIAYGMLLARAPLFTDSDKLALDAFARQPSSGAARIFSAQAFKRRFQRHSVNGAEPNRELAARCAQALVGIYDGIENCADTYFHMDRFTLRVEKAEVLPLVGRIDEAAAALGPVPPIDVELLSETDASGKAVQHSRRDSSRGYPRHTLAVAWNVLGEINLRKTVQNDLSRKQRLSFAELAAQNAEDSIAAHTRDHQAFILKARALFRQSDLLAESGNMDEAMRRYDAGIATLKAVPPTSLSSAAAKQGLSVMTPPKPPPAK